MFGKRIFAVMLAAAVAFGSAPVAGVPAGSVMAAKKAKKPVISLSEKSVGLLYGQSTTLKVNKKNVTKANKFKVLSWTESSKKKVISVTNKGKITSIGDGKSTVTVTYTLNGKKKKLTCKVEVYKPSISDKKINILAGGNPKTLEISDNKASVTWSSDNTSVATVSSDGTVQGVSGGTANITAKVGSKYSFVCTVTVYTEQQLEDDPDIEIDEDIEDDDDDWDEDDEDYDEDDEDWDDEDWEDEEDYDDYEE